ncbi:MAG: hypothetical protein A2252_05190 [Elusimicrobia bacterium RIFOXYA2_FULL_39_19]|nr:MAG: hypothetical protein A2252_05190 [Elusimicrobia bacterium RIFOXYA2_FULL_39_19]
MKKFLSLVLVLAVAAGSSFASCSSAVDEGLAGVVDTQNQSLGLQNFQVENSFNIWMNPAQVTEWKTVYAEVLNANTWGGANFRIPSGHLGVFVGRPYTGAANGFADVTSVGNIRALTNNPQTLNLTANNIADNMAPLAITNNNIDIIYGLQMGSNMSLGFRLSMADNSSDQSASYQNPDGLGSDSTLGDGTVSLKRATSEIQIGAGALLKQVGPFQKLDVALTIAMPKVDNKYTQSRIETSNTTDKETATDELKANNSANIGLLARGIMDMGGKKLFTTVGFVSADASSKRSTYADDTPTATGLDLNKEITYNDKTTSIILDAAMHTTPAKPFKVVYTAGIRSTSRTNEILETDLSLGRGAAAGTLTGPFCYEKEEINTLTIPISVAVEHQTWSKVCTRIGVQRDFYSKTTTKTLYHNFRDIDAIADADGGTTRDEADVDTSNEVTTNPNTQPATVTMGIGIVPAENFDIDIAIVTGAYAFNNLISRASIRYHF